MRGLRLAGAFMAVVLASGCASTTTPPPSTRSETVAIAGDWVLSTETPVGSYDSVMKVEQSGTAIAGTLESDRGVNSYTGTIAGNTVKFAFPMESLGPGTKFEYSGTIADGTMTGTASFGQFGAGKFIAKRSTQGRSPQ